MLKCCCGSAKVQDCGGSEVRSMECSGGVRLTTCGGACCGGMVAYFQQRDGKIGTYSHLLCVSSRKGTSCLCGTFAWVSRALCAAHPLAQGRQEGKEGGGFPYVIPNTERSEVEGSPCKRQGAGARRKYVGGGFSEIAKNAGIFSDGYCNPSVFAL